MKKGKLVRVEISPGRFVKIYESDLQKMKTPQSNKILKTETANKSESNPDADVVGSVPVFEEQPSDDLGSIAGIGPATVRALAAHGIETFEQLRSAGELVFLSSRVNEAIEIWRNS